MKTKSLRAWLRREPVPDKIKVRMEDGEEKDIHIPGDIRNRWKTVEASINASNAVAVECFDKKGTLLRAQELEHDAEEDENETPESKLEARRLKDWTGMLQAVMAEQNTSFKNGVAAAAQSQDSLVNLVDTMAQHFAAALTNIHNIVANMAIMQQQHAEQSAKQTQLIAQLTSGTEDGDPAVKQLIGVIAAQAMAGGMPKPKPNGAKPKEA